MTRPVVPVALALAFIAAAALWASLVVPDGPLAHLAILGAAATAYMALNIGANDVANNMGPAVGAKALTMVWALAIAALFDAAGAVLAGGSVVQTVSSDLLTLDADLSGTALVLVMIAALLAAALCINLSTYLGAPVSTTHAIIGGIVGAAVTAGGIDAIAWPMIGAISASWVISPLLGGLFAALIHTLIRTTITRRTDKIGAARIWVPILVAAMSGIFTLYLLTKALNGIWHPSPLVAAAVTLACAALGWLVATPWVKLRSHGMSNRKKHVSTLFRPPLIVAAAALSFAHGANDVANAAGPFAAIIAVVQSGAAIPDTGNLVVIGVLIGAVGIAVGLSLFGPRVIHTIGEQITRLNEIRAFCVALSSAVTVLAASALGLPISSTHVAVGAVFGVGFLREYLAIRHMHGAGVPIATRFLDHGMLNATPQQAIARERKHQRRYLVRRFKVLGIAAAWLVTLPASAGLAALLYLLLARFTS